MANSVKADSTKIFVENETVSGVYYSPIIDVQKIEKFSMFIDWEGSTFLGNVSIECSNDLSHDSIKKFGTVDRSVVKLKESDGRHTYSVAQVNYRYVRLRIEAIVGSATFNVHLNTRSGRI